MEETAIEIAQNLMTEFWEELQSVAEGKGLTSSIIVSRARDYNRKWNKLAETHPDIKIDGLKKLFKKQISETPLFRDQYPTALKYL